MTLQDYVDEIKLEITGGVLNSELSDDTIALIVKKSLREVRRYIDTTALITVPYSPCIDLAGFKFSSITQVYRTEGYTGDSNTSMIGGMADPMYVQQWMVFSNGGTMYNLNDYILNYASFNTLLQLRNTVSTDMAFKYDKTGNKLYINCGYDRPKQVTIEYVPAYENVEEITSDYWIDILLRLATAETKVKLGRIRTRFTQSNALWEQDGQILLEEGLTDLRELRERLAVNSSLMYIVD